jgi:general stress protein CsbA
VEKVNANEDGSNPVIRYSLTGGSIMKRAVILSLIFILTGCGYGMNYTKSVSVVPLDVLSLKVAEIEDIKRVSRRGEYVGRGSFVRNILINELRNSKRFRVDENSPYQLTVKIEDYRPSYHKYVALSATILDTAKNQTIWNSSISGLSKKTIDEVTQNVIQELVKEMVGKAK